MAKKINRRGHRGSQRVVILLCVPLRFFESSQEIIKNKPYFSLGMQMTSLICRP